MGGKDYLANTNNADRIYVCMYVSDTFWLVIIFENLNT